MPPAFNLPYGSVHDWHVGMYKELIKEAQGHKFAPFWSFDDDDEHEIAKIPFLGYFVPVGADKNAYYAIIPLNKEFRQRFDAAWRRLSKSNTLELVITNSTDAEIDVEKADKSKGEDKRALWEAKIQDHPNSELGSHCPSPRQFDAQLSDYRRKVEAVCRFCPDAKPSNLALFGLQELSESSEAAMSTEPDEPIPADLKF
ncbi:hypothetical protein EDB80DRAFT_868757 [Ilyonectria destructans]|nr:hypothetical protein EDB80DRAFT_868757 [Ilyonectria destructans]